VLVVLGDHCARRFDVGLGLHRLDRQGVKALLDGGRVVQRQQVRAGGERRAKRACCAIMPFPAGPDLPVRPGRERMRWWSPQLFEGMAPGIRMRGPIQRSGR